jgi:hypothetical protein
MCFLAEATQTVAGSVHYQGLEPRNAQKAHPFPFAVAPNEARNWTDNGDHPGEKKPYIYTTGYAVKEPGADGTSRGIVWVPFPYDGRYYVKIKSRFSGNRSTAYIGMVTEAGGTRTLTIFRWNQRHESGDSPQTLVPGVWEFLAGGE